MSQLYRQYLACDQATKRLAACGVKVSRFAFNGEGTQHRETFWRERFEDEMNDGEVPNLYRFADVQIYIEDFEDWSLPTEARDRAAQGRREQLVRDFHAQFPDTIIARFHDGQTYLYFEPFFSGGPAVTVNVGQALCERVQVGTRTVTKPDPERLAAIPLVQIEEPVFEWRCNDAELIPGGLR